MEVNLIGTGKFKKRGWLRCFLVKRNAKTLWVRVPDIGRAEIKVKNNRVRGEDEFEPATFISPDLIKFKKQTLWQRIKNLLASFLSRFTKGGKT